jgi:predicted nucleotidyltransferase/DNA-binding XRE family transcriptional regulator
MTQAAQIVAARRAAGLTQDELAARSGVRQPNIAAYEAGRRVPSAAMLSRLLAAAKPSAAAAVKQHRDQILRIANRNHAVDVRVFGSVARGTDAMDSDVDLLVTFDPKATLYDQARLVTELEMLLDRRVDVVSDRALGRRADSILADAVAL